MALCDGGCLPFEEPFPRIRLDGLVLTHTGAKMTNARQRRRTRTS